MNNYMALLDADGRVVMVLTKYATCVDGVLTDPHSLMCRRAGGSRACASLPWLAQVVKVVSPHPWAAVRPDEKTVCWQR